LSKTASGRGAATKRSRLGHAVGHTPPTPKRGNRRSRLTASQLPKLAIGDHTDPATKGLQLRVRAKSRAWLFRYRWRGEWVRLTIGHYPGLDLAEARDEAKELRKALDAGIDPRRARPKRNAKPGALPLSSAVADTHTVEYLVSEFIDRHLRPTRKRPEYAEGILEREILYEWKGRDARTIKPREVIDLLDGIVDRGSPVMANRTADLLAQLFKFGIHRHVVDASPVQLLYRPGGKEKPRERSLSDDELAIFLNGLDDVCRSPRIAAALRILLLTGQRRGELVSAKWSNVNLRAKTWSIPDGDAKAGRGHVVPLSDWAVREFKLLKRLARKSQFVFPAGDGSNPAAATLITRSVSRCRETWKKRGLEPFTPHDLRRTCRTGLARLKVPDPKNPKKTITAVSPHIAERVLNHAQEKIAGTYDVHDYLDEKREALEQWESHLRSLVAQ
jgi:integrase